MNEWLKKLISQVKALWSKWTLVQKLILFGVIAVAIVGIVVLVSVSASPSMVPLIDTPITDEAVRDRIIVRLNQENVHASVSATGVISVADDATARRMRSILISEDLIPQNVDPWSIFDIERWTITDFERNVNKRRAIIEQVRLHIKAIDDVDDASVVVNIPERTLFTADQNPVTASVVLFPKPGSDITSNRKKVEGIQKILKFAVEGLKDENITIADNSGNILNDFEGMKEWDRLTRIEKEQKIIARLESEYSAKVLTSLQKIYGMDRVRDLNIKIEMDMSEKTINTRDYLPTVIRSDNPDTPYDDSEIVETITLSSERSQTTWEGVGGNPEGPSGVEGQTPPAYKDMSNLYGKSTQTIEKVNNLVGQRDTLETASPAMGRRTVSVNIDGVWAKKRDENGNYIITNGGIEREYTPIAESEILAATRAVQDAIGYNRGRGDSVSVLNIQFDRTDQFEKEDGAYLRQIQTQRTILYSLIAVAAILIAFIVYRMVTRELERRRRMKEEEMLRLHQMEREKTLWEVEQAGMEVSMSVEERKRLELQENAINMAKEHPEDVALLIRTWLMEE
ncbi:flagellar M-ring protein FliF [Brucepastera parasyntrophica]|uniref:flagellar basal-body MS-ring/collar protein FliF n=1 Tax=Brucepastera parasyntrophica TaxID=2880008 RepID=UPI00210B0122|nr:flagellar basal-body MS-ring/collar protein FliF [Brucepastera parasyntrophica]ULQ60157.1 flagellar M-ring protein FliF [Brucepastera parasyntrophica]